MCGKPKRGVCKNLECSKPRVMTRNVATEVHRPKSQTHYLTRPRSLFERGRGSIVNIPRTPSRSRPALTGPESPHSSQNLDGPEGEFLIEGRGGENVWERTCPSAAQRGVMTVRHRERDRGGSAAGEAYVFQSERKNLSWGRGAGTLNGGD